MSLQWTAISYFLYFELGFAALLCVPWISSSRWHRIFQSRIVQTIGSNSQYYFGLFLALLALCFADAVREMLKYSHDDQDEVSLGNNPNTVDHIHMKLFRAQRNFYLSGFSMFMFILIGRMVYLISSEAKLSASHQAAMKQAKSATDAAQKLMEAPSSTSTADAEVTDQLRRELNEAKEALSKKERDFNAMKDQSEGTAREYDRLASDYQELEAKMNKMDGGDKKSD